MRSKGGSPITITATTSTEIEDRLVFWWWCGGKIFFSFFQLKHTLELRLLWRISLEIRRSSLPCSLFYESSLLEGGDWTWDSASQFECWWLGVAVAERCESMLGSCESYHR